MQILTRCQNDGVVIGDEIVVTVLEIQEDHVRISVSSPHMVPAYREEVLCLAGEEADRSEALQFH